MAGLAAKAQYSRSSTEPPDYLTGYDSTPTTLVSFNSAAGLGTTPTRALIADAAGDLYGTTLGNGISDHGTVFELTGAGFEPVLPSETIGGPYSGNEDSNRAQQPVGIGEPWRPADDDAERVVVHP